MKRQAYKNHTNRNLSIVIKMKKKKKKSRKSKDKMKNKNVTYLDKRFPYMSSSVIIILIYGV